MKANAIDRSAYSDAGFLHRVPVWAKLLAGGAVVTASVVSWNPFVLATIGVVIITLAGIGRLPLRILLSLSAYSLVFSGLIALAAAPGWYTGSAIILKALVATLAIITVGLSTPYPHLFGVLGRVLPGVVNDALIMTYRSIFILASVSSNLLTTMHLRGQLNWRRPVAALSSVGTAFGNLVLSAIDLSQRDYEVLRIRGYSDRIIVATSTSKHRGELHG